MRLPWVQVPVVLLLALLLGGCAAAPRPPVMGETGGDALLKDLPGKEQALQCEAGKERWQAAGPPKRGGIVRISAEALHLDPTAVGGRYSYHGGAYQYLARPRSCYFADTAMEPELAKSWQISPDGLTWTIKIQEKAKWQNRPPVDGRAFTSADVAWTIDYEVKEGALRTYWDGIAHREPDPQTIILTFKEPQADFLLTLGDERNVMLPHEVKERLGDFKSTLVGTGPWMVKAFKPGGDLTLERAPDYWEVGADGQPLPYLDGQQQIFFQDYSAEVAAVRSGQLDRNLNGGFRRLDADSFRQSNPTLRPFDDIAATVFGLWFNVPQKPWSDPRVRQAVNLAIDRDDLIASESGGAVYTAYLPAALGDLAWPQEKMQRAFKANQAKAKALLAEAGFTNNASPFVMKTVQLYSPLAEVVQKQLEAVGINTKITIEPGQAGGPLIAKGDFDLAYGPPGGGRFADYWLGGLVATKASRNVARFSDPKVDDWARAQAREMDAVKRKAILDQMQDYLMEAVPYVPTISRVYYRFDSCRVKNMRPTHQSTSNWGYQHAWINPAGC